jgi:hypothetical protein
VVSESSDGFRDCSTSDIHLHGQPKLAHSSVIPIDDKPHSLTHEMHSLTQAFALTARRRTCQQSTRPFGISTRRLRTSNSRLATTRSSSSALGLNVLLSDISRTIDDIAPTFAQAKGSLISHANPSGATTNGLREELQELRELVGKIHDARFYIKMIKKSNHAIIFPLGRTSG